MHSGRLTECILVGETEVKSYFQSPIRIRTADLLARFRHARCVSNYMLRNTAKTILLKENLQKIWSNFVELKEQGVIITCLTETCYKTTITVWNEIVLQVASNIVCFARRASGLRQRSDF